jgi:hypothetical protein
MSASNPEESRSSCVNCGRPIVFRETGRRADGEIVWLPFEVQKGWIRHYCKPRSGRARTRSFDTLTDEERERFEIPPDCKPSADGEGKS